MRILSKRKSYTLLVLYVLNHSAVSDSLRPHGLQPIRILCRWDFPGKNTGVGCHFLLQGIFLTQGWNPCLLHGQADSLPLHHLGSHMLVGMLICKFIWESSLAKFLVNLYSREMLANIHKRHKHNYSVQYFYTVIEKNCRQFKSSITISILRHSNSIDYSAVKINELELNISTWINLKNIMLRD